MPTSCEYAVEPANDRLEQIKKKNKGVTVKPFQVKNYMWIFVNAMIENPAFDSQTKDTLTLKSSAFGSKCELKEDFIKKGKSPVDEADSSFQNRYHRTSPQLCQIQAGSGDEEDGWVETYKVSKT